MRPWLVLAAIGALSGCAPGEEATLSPELAYALESELDQFHSLSAYADACKEELGLPATPLPAMNCLDGVEIPVTVMGQRPDRATYEALVAGEIGCDNPSWIGDGEPCANYSFILTQALSEEVVSALFCRQRSFSTHLTLAERRAAYESDPSEANFAALFHFESLGLIWTNTRTGATCFFERVHDTYGGHVPSPDTTGKPGLDDLPEPRPPEGMSETLWRQEAAVLWHSPQLMATSAQCASCHDSDPFVRSGHIQGLDVLPPHSPETPYYMASAVGLFHQTRNEPRALSTTPIEGPEGPEVQVCTSCHRIGDRLGCDRFSRYYTGQSPQPGQDAKTPYEWRVGMPPGAMWHGDEENEARWSEHYQAHVDKLLCCCDNPGALGCTLQDITQSPLPDPVAGSGPQSCEL